MKESRDKGLSIRVRDRDEGRKSKENGVSSLSKSKDEGPSPGSKRRRSESPMSPIDSRGKRETDNTSEEVGRCVIPIWGGNTDLAVRS